MAGPNQANDADDAATRKKLQLVQSRFGAVAADYVTSKVHASGEDLKWIVERAALSGSERVLDVATGGGHTAFALAPYAAEVVALDLTQEMLVVAEKEARNRNLHNIRFLQGDAHSLPCSDASFDLVTCRQAAHHFPNVRQCVQEWVRVLKPGGKLIVVDSISPEEPEVAAFLHEIESLRDPSHVCNLPLSLWNSMLDETGFSVRDAQEWGIFLDLPSWTQRMRTPVASIARIEQLFHAAPPQTRERLRIEKKDGAYGFTLPVGIILAVKSSSEK